MDGVSHFTFIDAPGSADATNVATGHASKVVEIASSHILYTLTISNAGLSVYSWIARRTDPTVTGTVVGTSMGLAVMKGFGRTATARKSGYIRGAWKFVDFTGNEYCWCVSLMGSTWKLLDSNHDKVAMFCLHTYQASPYRWPFVNEPGCIRTAVLAGSFDLSNGLPSC
ncbi:hypothetical protein DL89DRAFT_284590 [Linderina pennispora]|uniref:Uncharacterized protein n=1 Tax=Linderina pennispora TaxID=61395 RepID=A0A1Y1W6Z5_9FUNG|nr:uncharacterized protein DL89DRAFT_284590 [Linderina pennispora]ORX69313.1 hypothetical protein DL89DRAFT_284590 [Linderina pennispora]